MGSGDKVKPRGRRSEGSLLTGAENAFARSAIDAAGGAAGGARRKLCRVEAEAARSEVVNCTDERKPAENTGSCVKEKLNKVTRIVTVAPTPET